MATLLHHLRLPAGLLLLALGFAWLEDARLGALWLLGGALGFVLFRASFSFAAAFRDLLAERRGAGLRAQLVMLALAICLFLPVLEAGSLLGQPVRGFVFPVGVALLLGGFLFGIGMQLGGGCGSGTLYAAGSGQHPRMWITLLAFIVGATLAAWDGARWMAWPSLPGFSLERSLGAGPAIAISLALLGMIWWGSCKLEWRRHRAVAPLSWRGGTWLRGPWSLLWGAIALALLNFATLWLAGRPWAITSALPLWGSLAVEALGWDDPAFWLYWEEATRAEALFRPVWTDRTTLMDLGLMAGALVAAGLSARRAIGASNGASLGARPEPRAAAASLLGGLLLGYGAVLGTGCNISAYFGGIASGSLHGWVWILPALLGNAVGIRLRQLFGLAPRAVEEPRLILLKSPT